MTDKTQVTFTDPLIDTYRESITRKSGFIESLRQHNTALLVIDVQYLDAKRGYGLFSNAEMSGLPPESQEYYFNRLETMVLPNIRRLQDAFREAGLEVIHTRIQSLTRDGRDRGPGHKRLGLHAAPGTIEAKFLEEVEPMGDEIIINKTASGVFNSTNLEYVLRNLGITALVICGVYSNECVSTATRDACDLGFYVTIVEDGVATVTPELERATVTTMRDRYARILTTDEVIGEVGKLA
ncbi:cysteine hydrolase family protein [Thiothrix nivea]|uniref:Isochorismatase hydrolase n=1 Tax=Thiothrix nivea (strain ATCC 35100 / DSM 5205 / JP2) TaxID=870187 RepID=A0A656HFM1_THINJ|nr:isochorismatase family cysteine hydrolase [Thiothrix nivea]EIJ35247.1 isochorismatase hydrolase [Thiothrix nivea DSM 5205]